VRLELGAEVVLVDGVDVLYHLPARQKIRDFTMPTLCGLAGTTFRYAGIVRERRACAICRSKAPREIRAREPMDVPRRRRGGRPKWKYSRISKPQLEVLHRVYVDEQLSVRQVAERVWERLGYKSTQSCAESLDRLFRENGYQLRDRIEATRLASTKHGLAPKHGPRPGYGPYRRRVLAGKEDRPCKGVKRQSPRKGQPCGRHALEGSDFCVSHTAPAAGS
jgi:hypothetical protein